MTIGSRDFERSSSEYGQITSALASAAPFSFILWFKPESVGIVQTLFSIATSGSGNHLWRLDIAAADILRYRIRDTGGTDALTTNTVSAGNWYFAAIVEAANNDHRVFLGTNKGTSTTARTPVGANRTSIGRSSESSGTNYFDGKIALPTMWSVALSDAEIASLASGTYPTDVQSANVIHHWPFDGSDPEPDDVGADDFDMVGTTYDSADGPPVSAPSGGAQTITTAAPTAATVVYQPSVSPGAITITTAAPSASTTVYEPAVSPGPVSIVTAAPVSATEVYEPSVSPGAVTIQTAAPTAATEVFEPSIVPGAVTITTAAPVAATEVFEPSVSEGGLLQTIELATAFCSTSVFTPTQVRPWSTIGFPGPVSASRYPYPPPPAKKRKKRRSKKELEALMAKRHRERLEEEPLLLFLMEILHD